jgi:hypothetical protein
VRRARAIQAAVVLTLVVSCGEGRATDSGNIPALEKAVAVRPSDPAAWAALVDARLEDARSGDHFNQASGTFTPSGRAELQQARRAWGRYLALKPPIPSVDTALQMSVALGPAGLNDVADAVVAQEIVVVRRATDPGEHARLAALAYLAGETATGNYASARAVQLSPKSERSVLSRELDSVKIQARRAPVVPAP